MINHLIINISNNLTFDMTTAAVSEPVVYTLNTYSPDPTLLYYTSSVNDLPTLSFVINLPITISKFNPFDILPINPNGMAGSIIESTTDTGINLYTKLRITQDSSNVRKLKFDFYMRDEGSTSTYALQNTKSCIFRPYISKNMNRLTLPTGNASIQKAIFFN